MLLVANNDPSNKPKTNDQELLAQCDDVTLYKECGWYCLIGYKGQKRLLNLHFNSERERDFFVNPRAAAERYYGKDGKYGRDAAWMQARRNGYY